MSVTVYAANCEIVDGVKHFSPVIPFKHHEPQMRNPTMSYEDWLLYDGDDAFVPNPHYIPDCSMDLANGNADHLFSALGFDLSQHEGGAHYPIEQVHSAVMRGFNGSAKNKTRETVVEGGNGCATIYNMGVNTEQMTRYLSQLMTIVVEGKKNGAKYVVVA